MPIEDFADRLDNTIIAMPLIDKINNAIKKHGEEKGRKERFDIIVDLNLAYPKGKGLQSAKNKAVKIIKQVLASVDKEITGCSIDLEKSNYAYQHLFARLTGNQIKAFLKYCDGPLTGKGCPAHI